MNVIMLAFVKLTFMRKQIMRKHRMDVVFKLGNQLCPLTE